MPIFAHEVVLFYSEMPAYGRYDFSPLLSCGYQTYLVAKFIRVVRLSFGNATSKRFVKTVNFILVFFLLIYSPLGMCPLIRIINTLLFLEITPPYLVWRRNRSCR